MILRHSTFNSGNEYERASLTRLNTELYCCCRALLEAREFLRKEIDRIPACQQKCELESVALGEIRGDVGAFDLIYSNSLLTELAQMPARQAIAQAAHLLKPGGRLLLTNIAFGKVGESCPACVHSRRVSRTPEELADLTSDIPTADIAGQIIFRDDSGSNLCLELHKKA